MKNKVIFQIGICALALCVSSWAVAQKIEIPIVFKLSVASVNYRVKEIQDPSFPPWGTVGSTEVKLGGEYHWRIQKNFRLHAGLMPGLRLPTGSFNNQGVGTFVDAPFLCDYSLSTSLSLGMGINLRYNISRYSNDPTSWGAVITRGSNVGIVGTIEYRPLARISFSLDYLYFPQRIEHHLFAYKVSANSISLTAYYKPW